MLTRRHLLAAFAAAPTPAAAQPRRLKVVASFSILGDFVREIGGGAVDAASLVGPDRDAHIFEPSPGDARALAAADVVVVNGLGFEGWMTRLVAASGFRGTTIIATRGVTAIRRAAPAGGRAQAGTSGDPHAWQDPLRARAMVGNIAAGLAAADPARAELYRANAAAYDAKLAALDTWVQAQLADVPPARRQVVASHDSFAYFTDRYSVAFRAPRGVSTEIEPSAADFARIIRVLRREQARIVFLENISDPRMIEQLAREAGARIGGRLYADALSGADGPAPTYLALMRHNVTLLREAMLAE